MMLKQGPASTINANAENFPDQHEDVDLQPKINYCEEDQLPKDHKLAQRIVTEATLYLRHV